MTSAGKTGQRGSAVTESPTYSDVVAAAERIGSEVHRTPLLTSRLVDSETGARVFFKAENLQRAGSFKIRGALNALSLLDADQRAAGVVAYSSGNHAQAIALAAAILKIPVVVVMPTDAPATKLAATQAYGASVITYDRYTEDRERIGAELAEDKGMALIPPYDHPHVIAGQGTAVKELLEDTGPLDMVFVPLGGGGLLSGSLLSTKALAPDCAVYGVEPEAGDDGRRSLRTGTIVHIDTPVTIADGTQTQHLGEHTFPIIKRDVEDIVTAADTELVEAMALFAARMKIVVEPSGCLGLAALLGTAVRDPGAVAGRRIGVVISGGNVDLGRMAQLLASRSR
ncbi:MAG: threo-3-hydroxy-L-aspartate ammonia-lyase [Kutzneria sp.]|nr:threo-3-hydroxy-L-aspartate ammonia-lyase [Kutzneria sp.]